MVVAESLLPIFLLIGLGALLTARGFLTPESLKSLNRLAYYVAMPGLLFASVSRSDAVGARPLRITLVLVGASLSVLAIGWLIGRLMKIPSASMGTFVQSCFRGNLAFVGLPIVLYLFDRPGVSGGDPETVPMIAIAIAPVMVTYNILAVIVLVASHHKVSRDSTWLVVKQVVTNPLVIAVVAGFAASHLSFQLPGAIDGTISAVGAMAIPAALFGVGGTIIHAPFRANLAPAFAASVCKVVFMPLLGFTFARWLALEPTDAALATMLCATPTAAASFIMSLQLRGDPAIASSSIAVSTLLSAASLAIALSLVP